MKFFTLLFFLFLTYSLQGMNNHPDDSQPAIINPLKITRAFGAISNLLDLRESAQQEKYGKENVPSSLYEDLESRKLVSKSVPLKQMNTKTVEAARKEGIVSFATQKAIWIDTDQFLSLDESLQNHIMQKSILETKYLDTTLRKIALYDVGVGLLAASLIRYSKKIQPHQKTFLHNPKLIGAAGLGVAMSGPYLLSCTPLDQELTLQRFAQIQKNGSKNQTHNLSQLAHYFDDQLLFYKKKGTHAPLIQEKRDIVIEILEQQEDKKLQEKSRQEQKKESFEKKLRKILKKTTLDHDEIEQYRECLQQQKNKQFPHLDKEGPDLSDPYLTPLIAACKRQRENKRNL